MAVSTRPVLRRSVSCPSLSTSSLRIAPDITSDTSQSSDRAAPAPTEPEQPIDDFVDTPDDVEDHPENHFLSPMASYEYDSWSDSDSDEDSDDVPWDAGIMDFALFDSDRQKAEADNNRLDGRWDGFIQSQREALRRSVRRARTEDEDAEIDATKPPLPVTTPDLTPDHSPELRDDLELGSLDGASSRRPAVPEFLTKTVAPSGSMFEEDDDLPLSFTFRPRRDAGLRSQRPGLRHARTMSGKVHSWKRPSWKIYSLGEDAEAEERAELCDSIGMEEAPRGRR